MIILGIDPGLATTGFGVVEQIAGNLKHVAHGCLFTPKNMPFAGRLALLQQDLEQLIKKYSPQQAGVEELFFYKNVKTALAVGHARGVIMLTLFQLHIPTYELTPLQVKQATTGYGQADKQQIQKMVQAQLHLPEIPRPDDAADALAIALTTATFKPELART